LLDCEHLEKLRESALSDKMIIQMGCYTCYSWPPGFNQRPPYPESLLAFPYPGIPDPDNPKELFTRYRLYPPITTKDGKQLRYWQRTNKDPNKLGYHLFILPSVKEILANPKIQLGITEGEKKAASLTQHIMPTIAIPGVTCWGDGKGGLHP